MRHKRPNSGVKTDTLPRGEACELTAHGFPSGALAPSATPLPVLALSTLPLWRHRSMYQVRKADSPQGAGA